MTKPLDLFSFHGYRNYLKAWIEHARENQTSNLSRLAEAIGVNPSFLAHVQSGLKNLSFEQAALISKIFNHTNLEREYFFALVQIERAGTQLLKTYWESKKDAILEERSRVKSRVGKHLELTSEDRAIFYSSWIYVAVFVATAINDGQTLDQIASRFSLDRSKAEEILNFLESNGICGRENSIYKMAQNSVYISNDSPLVVKHHTNWRMKGIQKMDSRQKNELFYTSPMSISASDFERIRELLLKSIESSQKIAHASAAEEVFCLNLDFFKVAT
ncbi:MAG: TIGR02147 family protein [Pseudomonadota bacterium]|nr:TIGR02147 family protein [Pseudomonadota bacterium]